jgi:enoyl-CoA hydratase
MSPTERTVDVTVELVVHLDDGKANALSFEMIAAISPRARHRPRPTTRSAPSCCTVGEGKFSAGFDLSVMRGGDFTCGGHAGQRRWRPRATAVRLVGARRGRLHRPRARCRCTDAARLRRAHRRRHRLQDRAQRGRHRHGPAGNWAITIAQDRLSRRHIQLAVATAQVTDGRGAVEAGFLDEAVPEADVLPRAIERAAELAALNGRAYAGTVLALRARCSTHGGADHRDREAGSSPIV